jgi:hypothetical protein
MAKIPTSAEAKKARVLPMSVSYSPKRALQHSISVDSDRKSRSWALQQISRIAAGHFDEWFQVQDRVSKPDLVSTSGRRRQRHVGIFSL